MMKAFTEEAIALLQKLITMESFSKTEEKTADTIFSFLQSKDIPANRFFNNVWVLNKYYDPKKPTVLLNSHHDTVKPNPDYTRDPFEAKIENGKLFGLGSNDAGGSLVSLLACFLHFYDKQDLAFNLVYAATAEEEISGKYGVEIVLPKLGEIYFGIVGEPTKMNIAVAEKGLLVVDCTVNGISGHAARDEGDNAIYKALKDIEWFKTFKFPNISETLGSVKMTVSMLQAGTQHNVVPATCQFTVDIRTTDLYSNQEVLDIISQHVSCKVQPRSVRLNSSFVSKEHPMVKAGILCGRSLFGSPTTSDQALMNFPTFKMGPGDSARSHAANEFIFLHEIEEGIDLYIQLLKTFNSLL
jgi:acetylornithine deacetylase